MVGARSSAYEVLTLPVQGLLFFIPWMAGVPVYLAGGVVITAAFKQLFGFWPALGIAVAVTSATKAIAVFALHRFLGAVRRCVAACCGALAADTRRGGAGLDERRRPAQRL